MACLCLLPCSLMCLGSRVAPVPSYTPFSITLNKCWWGFLTEEPELLILENDSVWTLSEDCSHRLTLYNTLPRPCIWSSWAAGSPVSFIESGLQKSSFYFLQLSLYFWDSLSFLFWNGFQEKEGTEIFSLHHLKTRRPPWTQLYFEKCFLI